jgi:uncharacterized protein YciI
VIRLFVVLLRFADRSRAGEHVDGHNAWIERGFDDGVFLMTGSLRPALGGTVLAHGTTLADLQERVDADPFVAHGVVTAEILEIAPSRTDDRLAALLHPAA